MKADINQDYIYIELLIEYLIKKYYTTYTTNSQYCSFNFVFYKNEANPNNIFYITRSYGNFNGILNEDRKPKIFREDNFLQGKNHCERDIVYLLVIFTIITMVLNCIEKKKCNIIISSDMFKRSTHLIIYEVEEKYLRNNDWNKKTRKDEEEISSQSFLIA